jgi:hypothetical protein
MNSRIMTSARNTVFNSALIWYVRCYDGSPTPRPRRGETNNLPPGILGIQGLQSPASRTRLSSPLDLTVANSAPGHYSRYRAYSPCVDHHKLLHVKSRFFFNKFVNILNTPVLSHSARRTRLLWPLKSSHYRRQWSVFIWRNSQSVDSTWFRTQACTFVQRDPRTSYFKTLSGKSPNRQV